MPVKLGAKLPAIESEARIEIIPLIDIMFFLLASFMLVSLSMVNMKSVRVDLPTATTATPQPKTDFIDVSINKAGETFVDKKPVAANELIASLAAASKKNPHIQIYISGDKDARHGDVIHVLDLIRSAGVERVAFEIHAPNQTRPS